MGTSLKATSNFRYRCVAKLTATAGLAILAFTMLHTKHRQPILGFKYNSRTGSSAMDVRTVSIISDPQVLDYQSESQFEMLWPSYELPLWAKKTMNYDIPSSQSICFVHVGKAGGSAVGCSLGFSLHCGNSTQMDGVLPKITTTIFHKDVYDCHDDQAYYLFAIRDPIKRAISAFNYDRPDISDSYIYGRYIRFYEDCSFSTIEGWLRNICIDFYNFVRRVLR